MDAGPIMTVGSTGGVQRDSVQGYATSPLDASSPGDAGRTLGKKALARQDVVVHGLPYGYVTPPP